LVLTMPVPARAALFATAVLLCASVQAYDETTDHTCVYNCGDSAPAARSAGSGTVFPGRAAEQARERRALEENQRAATQEMNRRQRDFNEGRDAAARELRGVADTDDTIKVEDDLKDAPISKKKTPSPNPRASGKPKPTPPVAVARPGEPATTDEIPANWKCYEPPQPQDGGAWEYYQCAGSPEERGRLHCFTKIGKQLWPRECFKH
jgi:hypothetical protein